MPRLFLYFFLVALASPLVAMLNEMVKDGVECLSVNMAVRE